MSHIKHLQSTETATITPHISHLVAAEARLSRLHRLFKKNFNVTEPSLILEPYLFLGNCISAQDINRLSKLGIRYILNVAIRDVEICPYYSSDMRILTIDLRDDDRENIIRIFDEAFTFIDEAKANKSRVLVHCSHGQSRSPAIVIAYLMRTYNVPLEECLIHVIKARPCVLPNDGFLKQLILFDRFLAERRRKRLEAAVREAVESVSVSPTEIPIEHQSSIAPEPKQSSLSKQIEIQTSNVKNKSPTPSSAIGKGSGPSVKSHGSSDSIHFIPIQVEAQIPHHEKVKEVRIEKIPVKNESVEPEIKRKVKKPKEKIRVPSKEKMIAESNIEVSSSSHVAPSKRRSSAYITNIIKQTVSSPTRSYSAHSNRGDTSHYYDYYAPSSTHEPRNNTSPYYYEHDRRLRERTRTRYITEIYDKATNRFIPTTC